ncbi:MAG TPA: PD-(D/E)XK nuclease family protein [Thermoanaerobaculia bacterium]|nr:PD-(D/E)XK nuclease family protein [Thermoanaerobaculia bacterium]
MRADWPLNDNLPLYSGRYADIAAALGERLHRELSRDPLDGPAVHLLVPSRSAASGVARAILAHRPDGFAGIYFNSPELLARRVLNLAGEYPPKLEETQRQILMKQAVQGAGHPLLSAHGMDSMIGRSHRDVRDSGASLEQLKARLSDSSGRLEDRHAALLAAGRLYEEYLRALALPQPADLLERAIRLLDDGSRLPPQIVFGFYDMTGLQERLLQALSRRGLLNSIWLPIPLDGNSVPPSYAYAAGFAARVRAGGVEALATSREDATPARRSIRMQFTPREEMREICRTVRRRLDEGTRIDEIGIVSRSVDPTSSRLARQYAREFGFDIQIHEERPLRSHRIGRSILRLLEITERNFPRNMVIGLLRDGLSIAPTLTAREIDRIDHATRKHQIAGGTGAELARAAKGVETRERKTIPELASYAAAAGEIERITFGIPPTGTGGAWGKLLRGFALLFRPRTEQDLQAIEAVEMLSSQLESLERAELNLVSKDIVAAMQDLILDSSPTAPAVWFGDVMTMRGRAFRHLFVFGMQEDKLPQRRVPDPLLSDRERGSAGLPLIGDGREEEELLFQLMLDAAGDEVVLSFARSDGFGKVLRPSPFLARAVEGWTVEAEEAGPRDETLHDGGAKPAMSGPPRQDATLSPIERQIALLTTSPEQFSPPASFVRKLRLASSVGLRSSYDGYIELSERAAAEVRRRLEIVSPTWFEDFGECPQKFLFRRLLRADELEDPEHEPQINHRDKGGLDHRILERFYRETGGRLFAVDAAACSELPGDLKNELHRIVDEEFDRFDQEFPPFNRRIRDFERVSTRSNLERFILGDLEEMAASGFRPAYFEFSFGTDRHRPADHPSPVTIDLEPAGISIRGTIDRIDRKGELYYRVVDYKSGTASGHTTLGKKIDAGHKLQLALYALAASSMFDAEPSRVSGTIRPIGSDRPKASHTFELGERETLLANLSLFSSSILGGRFPALPDDEGACRYCTMKLACRSRHDPEERRRMRRYKTAIELLDEGVDD